jgi:hypothetical protein
MKKQMLNEEFLKMQKLAGLITESEYKTKLNENKNIVSILRSWDAAKGDRLDYQTVANMIEIGRYEAAAKFISDELDTSVKEMIMDIIEENDPELYKKMFNSTADSSKFKRSNTLTPIAAAFRISKGEDYETLAQQYPNLNDPEVKAQIMDLIDDKSQLNENEDEDFDDEDFDLNQAFKDAPNEALYREVLKVFKEYNDDSIIEDFKDRFPKGEPVNKDDYSEFAMTLIDDMSEVAFIQANWISIFDEDIYEKAGMV